MFYPIVLKHMHLDKHHVSNKCNLQDHQTARRQQRLAIHFAAMVHNRKQYPREGARQRITPPTIQELPSKLTRYAPKEFKAYE